jgi:hypothetical protein
VTHLNEGHLPGHHRDGFAAQLGVETELGGRGLSLRAAAGPYRYFDTEVAESAAGFADSHGSALLYTLATRWQADAASRWFYQLRVDRIEARRGQDTTMVLAGLGYRLDQDGSFPSNASPRGKGGNGELGVALGQTIVNSFESQRSTARAVEYRHAFGPVLRAAVGVMNEGDARLIRRNGLVAQVWLEPGFEDGRYSLGIGYGRYFAVDAYRSEERHSMGLLSATTSYRLAPSWVGRITWHRSVSNYDRDSDVLLLGVGYRF